MNMQFLGTGAADWNWSNPDPMTRGSCSTLVNRHILIDAGQSILWNLSRCGIRCCDITDIFITHSHEDHFLPEAIAAIARDSARVIRLFASPQALNRLPDDLPLLKMPLSAGEKWKLEDVTVSVMPANHAVDDLTESAFHFLLDDGKRRIYYALDGGWMGAVERLMLEQYAPVDAIVWDSTCGNTFEDWRFAEHNDLRMIDMMRHSLLKLNIITPETFHIFDHVARTLWPESPTDCRTLADAFGGILAEDGASFSL